MIKKLLPSIVYCFLFLLFIIFSPHSASAYTEKHGDFRCWTNEYNFGSGLNGFYTYDTTTTPPGKKPSTPSYCPKNEMCISTKVRTESGLPVNPSSPCYLYCYCARSGSHGIAIYPSDGKDITGGNGDANSGWGYYCGNSNLFPNQYIAKGGYGDYGDITHTPSLCGVPSVCVPGAREGLVSFKAITQGDCKQVTGDPSTFYCFNKDQTRGCGTNAVFDPNIKTGWPCKTLGTTVPTPTPGVCQDSTIPDKIGSDGQGISLPDKPIPPDAEVCPGGECDTAFGKIKVDSPAAILGRIFGILLSISGILALVLIIASGYQMSTSQGNPEKIKEARERLTAAIIGLLFIIFSVSVLQIIGVDILAIPGFK
jgi:hypothetical protein